MEHMVHERDLQDGYRTQVVQPKVLYYGTPVVLLSTLNEDGSSNLSPMSSAWSLGSSVVLGLGLGGKGLENLRRHAECVLNLPGPSLWKAVEALAPLTGKDPVPEYKEAQFRFERDKFGAAGLTPLASERVRPERIAECPLQLEASVKHVRIPEHQPHFAIVEVEVLRVHAHKDIIIDENHINPNQWSPLIYNFRHYFGLGPELGKSFRATT
jgi:flavin reductase (DIM6/NTAB) family NADH-FMN oxidoreductase RutF